MSELLPYGYVYEIVNKVNGKTYIGCRKLSLDKSWRGYMGSGILISKAIKKYGIENFVKKFICYEYDIDTLFNSELDYIKKMKSSGLGGQYNISSSIRSGGDTISGLPENKKVSIRERQVDGLRRAREEGRLCREKEVEKRNLYWSGKFNDNKDEIISYYLETGSIRKVSDKFKFPRGRLRTFIVNSGVSLNKMNVSTDNKFGEAKRKLEEHYESLRTYRNMKTEKNCTICGKIFISNNDDSLYCSQKCHGIVLRKFNPEREELYRLYVTEDKNISELMSIYKCSQRTVYNMLERNDIPRKRSNKNKN